MSEPQTVPDHELNFDSDLVCTLNGKEFTGVAYEDSPKFGRSELTYRGGIQEGPARDWYLNGVLKSESNFVGGIQHGRSMEYDDSGRPVEEAHFEYGIRVSMRRFNPQGEVVMAEDLDPVSEEAQLLARLRAERGWAS